VTSRWPATKTCSHSDKTQTQVRRGADGRDPSAPAPNLRRRHILGGAIPRGCQILGIRKSWLLLNHTHISTHIFCMGVRYKFRMSAKVPVIESWVNLQTKSWTERQKESNTKSMREKTQPNHSAEICLSLSLSLFLCLPSAQPQPPPNPINHVCSLTGK